MIQFNYWIGEGFQTIRLTERLAVSFREGGATEEGYSYTDYYFSFEEGLVRMTLTTEAKDCDGRLESYTKWTCSPEKLESKVTEDGTKVPDWTQVDSWQRDYSAEAMGY
jgi:hypothetical protein